jgi:hypothetical protein
VAFAFLLPISPARAEIATLVCQNQSGTGGSFTLRVDYDRKVVALLSSNGNTLFSSAAQVTDSDVTWEVAVQNMSGFKFMGTLNRLSGQGGVIFPTRYSENKVTSDHWYGPCSHATQKF